MIISYEINNYLGRSIAPNYLKKLAHLIEAPKMQVIVVICILWKSRRILKKVEVETQEENSERQKERKEMAGREVREYTNLSDPKGSNYVYNTSICLNLHIIMLKLL